MVKAVRRVVSGIQVIGGLFDLVAVVVAVGFINGNAAGGMVGGLFTDAVISRIVTVLGGLFCVGRFD